MCQRFWLPYVLKDEPEGRRLAWLNRDLWLEVGEKKRVYDLWKKVQAAQEDCKDVVKLEQRKLERAQG